MGPQHLSLYAGSPSFPQDFATSMEEKPQPRLAERLLDQPLHLFQVHRWLVGHDDLTCM